ncbi:MAG: membrane protein FdrA [Firmicutes bacterium ADurb.Bin182]|nr:MAG: membrane protein FdrA [Firmicutes bacterium ADurb.Bin182]
MSKVNELFGKKLAIVNFGIESFYRDLSRQNQSAVHVDWKPAAGGNKAAAEMLRKLREPSIAKKIDAANKEALKRILAAKPVLIGLSTAGEAIPGMTKTTVLHAGPPVTWERMCGPVRGAVMGGLVYEGLAKDIAEAEELAASGKITFDPCHHHNTVGPMAGVVTYSMPVWHIVNKTFGNDAFCTLNEGLGKVLRFGACDEGVYSRLRWMKNVLYPVLKEAMQIKGEIDLKVMIAQALQMGDEVHNRNKAATSLFIREIFPAVMKCSRSDEDKIAALEFINGNDHTFLNLSMPAAKCTMDPVFDIPYSTVLATMSRNGTDFGIRVAGLGPDKWFTAPAEIVDGLYFPGYSDKDANPDLGDSCITETAGIGGFCMAASPAIVQFVGGKVQDAIRYSTEMYEITVGEGNAYKIPALNFRGSATAVDILRVVETGIRPIINTGIAHKDYGVGQVGAGIVRPPLNCFLQALYECSNRWA